MKKTFTLLFAICLTASLYAFDGQPKLSITSTSASNIRVMVDGNKYKSNGNNTIMINDLEQGFHNIKVYRLKKDRVSNNNNGYNGNNGNNGYGNNFSRYELMYSSRVYLKPQYFVDIVINRFGKAFIDEQLMTAGNYYGDDDDDDWGNDDNNNNNNNSGYGNYGRAMSAPAFDQFKQSLQNESFDQSRLSMAKQVISTNFFTSQQVKEIVQQFSFESSRLDIAKFAYKFTIDKGSYFLVYDAFSFSSSKAELAEFVKTSGQ